MKPISTKVHGILDFATVGTLWTLPQLLRWGGRTKIMLGVAGAGMLGYSLCTRYQYGLVKALPMKTHLLLDYISGATVAALPLLLRDETFITKLMLAGLGLNEITIAALTEPNPPVTEQMKYGYLDLVS